MSDEGLRLRQVINDDSSRSNNNSKLADGKAINSSNREKQNDQKRGRSNSTSERKAEADGWVLRSTVTLHVAAVLLVLYGFYHRVGFHNGDECEMTYSMRNYVPIRTHHQQEDGSTPTSYNLFKFVDARDPRHENILKKSKTDHLPIPDASHCTTNDAFVVLYIPGHWGDYTQCRSVGAHGTQLTRSGHDRQFATTARQSLYDGTWNGGADLEEHFVYDVYCVDFAEQGAALHGNFIQKQSQYVAQVVEKLSHECSVSAVTLVAHSIGGLVAKAVPVYHPTVADKIRNIITLATPHVALPFAFDESLHNIYHDLKSLNTNTVLIISISGGLKDELIPASLCEAKAGVSQMAGSLYGMDHKAVVWCHQVLEKVRNILYIQSKDETVNRKATIERSGVNGSYSNLVAGQKAQYKEQYGYISFIALELAMLYNAELLLAIYSLLCGFYLVEPNLSPWIPVVSVAGMATAASNHGISVLSTLAISLLSSTIVWGLRVGLPCLPRVIQSRTISLSSGARVAAVTITALFAAISVTALLVGTLLGRPTRWQIRSTIVIALVVWIITEALRTNPLNNPRNVTFASLILVGVPFLTFGKVVLFCWNVLDNYGELDIAFAIKIGLPIAIRFSVGKSASNFASMKKNTNQHNSVKQQVCIVAHALSMLFFATGMMQIGGGYLVGYYIACIALVESVRIATY